MNKRAASVLEYSIIFGIIAIVLFAMSTYIKRSFQGQVKDMADNFIGGGNQMQAADYYVNAIVSSNSTSNSSSNMTATDMLGGARAISLNEVAQSSSSSNVVDTRRIIDTTGVSGALSDSGVVYQSSNTSTNSGQQQ